MTGDASARSKNGVLIRLPAERWQHIVEHHDDVAGRFHEVLEAVEAPDAIYEGSAGELLAVSRRDEVSHLVVVYRELSPTDGFVITAFLTARLRQIERRRLVWRNQ